MKTPATLMATAALSLLFTGCPKSDEAKTYDPKKDPEIGFINNRLVPRTCEKISTKHETHRVFTLPSFSFMSVKVDLGKMDLDPKQVEPVTEALIALSWGRENLCLNVKQRASGSSEERYQEAWDQYFANTEKLSQFALIALVYKPSATQTGAPKPGSEANATKVKEVSNAKESNASKVVEVVQKWLESYGEPKKAQPEKKAATKPESAEAMPEAPETRSERLQRLSRELIKRPARHDSAVGL